MYKQLTESVDKDPYLFIPLILPFFRLLPLIPHPPLLLPPPLSSPATYLLHKDFTNCVPMGNLKLKYLLSNFDILLQMSVDLLIPFNNLIWLLLQVLLEQRVESKSGDNNIFVIHFWFHLAKF